MSDGNRSKSPRVFWQEEEKRAQAQGLLTKPLSPRASPTSPGTYRKIRMTPPTAGKPSSPKVKSSPVAGEPLPSTSGKSPSRVQSKSPSRRSRSPAGVVAKTPPRSSVPVKVTEPTMKPEQLEISMTAKETEWPHPPPPLQIVLPPEPVLVTAAPVESKSEELAENLTATEPERGVQEPMKGKDTEEKAPTEALAEAPAAAEGSVQETGKKDEVAVVFDKVFTTLSEAVQNCDISGVVPLDETQDGEQMEPQEKIRELVETTDEKQEEKANLDETVDVAETAVLHDMGTTALVVDQ